jgi:hypothetical protein
MDFEALKVIWDSQNHEPLYAVNETALHASVRRRNRAFQRRIFWRDVREIGIGLAAGAGFFVFGWMLAFASKDRWRSLSGSGFEISRGDALMMLTASGLWLFYAGYQLVGRKRQENRERLFESSLRGDLCRTLAQTEYQIQLARSAVWWGVVPVCGDRAVRVCHRHDRAHAARGPGPCRNRDPSGLRARPLVETPPGQDSSFH